MTENKRLLAIDAVRGIAMFFVGVSHVSLFVVGSAPLFSSTLRWVGFFATPNFLLMSGLACGYQLARATSGATALRIVDRGLFVVLVGHVLVAASLVYIVPPGTAFEHVVITDTIGVMLCMAPLLRNVSSRRLAIAGAVLFLSASLVSLSWRPTTLVGAVVGGALFGIDVRMLPDEGWITATLSLMGFFLVGVGIGKAIAQYRSDGRARALWLKLTLGGSVAVATGATLNLSRHFLKPLLQTHFPASAWANILLTALEVRHKTPPVVAYALFYGGIGITLVGLFGLLPPAEQGSSALGRGVRLAAVIGRASFVSYVSVQWLIDFIPFWVGFETWLTPPPATVIYLLLTTLVVFWIARAWDRRQANRYLTVGLKPLQRVPQASFRL